jgi:hypothetical protein
MRKTGLILITAIAVSLLYVATIFAQPNLEVSGIMKGKDKRAMVNGEIVKEGDAVNGAEVIEIGDDFVKFKYEGEFFTKKAEVEYQRSDSSSEKRMESQKIKDKQKLDKVEKKTGAGIPIKNISDIKSVTLIVRSCLLEKNLKYYGPSGFLHTIRGIVVFYDQKGRQCAVDYDGTAELSCEFFYKQFNISSGDFNETTWPDGKKRYAYTIREFDLTFDESHGKLFTRPYETVKFKIENLEDTCELSPNR